MTGRETTAAGLEYLTLVTALLQRARLADPYAGMWEAADLQWWWRTPRASDELPQAFWVDDAGPTAAAVLTEWRHRWQLDLLTVPRAPAPSIDRIVARGLERCDDLRLDIVEVYVRDDDAALRAALADAGFVPTDEQGGTTWLHANERPPLSAPAAGFALVDRAGAQGSGHPMRRRSGEQVETRLRQCSLYDPELDLALVAPGADVAGYALFWADAVTGVGLVEPMRVEDAYGRRGLAFALLTEGVDRLAARGMQRLKVGYATDAARRLYERAGFRTTSTETTFRRTRR